MRRLNLTLAGTGGGSSGAAGGFGSLFSRMSSSIPRGIGAPPPPAAPTPAAAPAATKLKSTVRTGAENIRNRGGGRGLSTANTMRALKSLTGQ